MKPLSGDHRHRLLITGDELRELKRHTAAMAEAFGLDRKIENYQGIRPITLYRWDLDCLMDVIDYALKDQRDYPDQTTSEYQALKKLGERLHQEYDAVYGDEKALPLGKTTTSTSKPIKSISVKASRKQSSNSSKQPVTLYRLKITLTGVKPLIWRRVEVEDCTLLKLHKIIQVCMGWQGFHAWAFFIEDEEYGDDVIDAGGDREFVSARKIKLSKVVNQGTSKFHYLYDFGDSWEHVIQVEKVLKVDPQVKYPRCVKGSRACPPEDCGGTRGYEELLAAVQNPAHEQHEEVLEWVGGKFDPEAFDLEAVNKTLPTVR